MESWYSAPINMFLQKQLVSFIFVALTYFLLNRYSTCLVSFICTPLKKLRTLTDSLRESSADETRNCAKEKALAHFRRGQEFMLTDQHDAAISEFRCSLMINSRMFNGQIQLALARCELAKGNTEAALKSLEGALDWFPSINTRYAVGGLYSKLGNRKKAREIFIDTVRGYRVQLKFRKRSEWRWAFLALCRSFVP